jgi:hypothetical protein
MSTYGSGFQVRQESHTDDAGGTVLECVSQERRKVIDKREWA